MGKIQILCCHFLSSDALAPRAVPWLCSASTRGTAEPGRHPQGLLAGGDREREDRERVDHNREDRDRADCDRGAPHPAWLSTEAPALQHSHVESRNIESTERF